MTIGEKIKLRLAQLYSIISNILIFACLFTIKDKIILDNLMPILGINWLFSSVLLACIYDEYKLL